jgi:hypothetical protein
MVFLEIVIFFVCMQDQEEQNPNGGNFFKHEFQMIYTMWKTNWKVLQECI